MIKKIVLKIKVDCEKDEVATLISTEGFDTSKGIQNTLEIISLLEKVRQDEFKKLDRMVKK